MQLLEKSKFSIHDDESIGILIADNTELITFAKKIALELYQLTHSDEYLNQVINLHESGIYNRLRARLDKQKAISFSHLPAAVYEEEKKLKAAIPASLQGDRPNTELMDAYVQATSKWQQHLNKIRTEYPVYYKMRYGSIFKSLPQLQASLPPATTVITDFLSTAALTHLCSTKAAKKLFILMRLVLIKKLMTCLLPAAMKAPKQPYFINCMNHCGNPWPNDIHTKNIIIIPDGIFIQREF